MTDDEAKTVMTEGLEMLGQWSRLIAMLPLEDWITAFERAESVAPFLDPTLYREYLYSGKGDIVKGMIKAALPLKKFIVEQQSKIAAAVALEAP